MKQEKLHPIQLVYLGVRELFIKCNVPPEKTIEGDVDKVSLSVQSPKKLDTTYNAFDVSVILELGMEEKTEAPYSMRIVLKGFFQVMDTTKFPPEKVLAWAKNGAMYILYPFLREHAFSLSSRGGYSPLLLPLLEVPTFRVAESPKESD